MQPPDQQPGVPGQPPQYEPPQGPPPGPPPPYQAPQAPPPAYQPPAYQPPDPAAYQPPGPAGPYYGAPTPPRRSRGPLIAIIAIVLLVLIAAGGYVVASFAYGNSRVDSARTTYNGVIDSENKQTDFFNKLTAQINAIDPKNATKDTVAQAKTLFQQLVTQSQGAQPTIANDDQSLADAQTKLKENQWLTAIRSSDINRWQTKIGDLRSAVGVAKTITADYVLYGNFNVAFADSINDILAIGDAGNNNDFVALGTAATQLKADVAKAISLDHAPGLPSDTDTFMQSLQALATDFGSLVSAAAAGDQAGATAADNAVNADVTKLDAYDTSKLQTEANNFYGGLVGQYNKYVDQANKD